MRQITQKDEENAQRLKAIWAKKKADLNLTQAKAAERLGFKSQGTIAQYLNCHIALNHSSVLAFAKLLEVAPWEIDPALATLKRVGTAIPQGTEVVVMRTFSGAGRPEQQTATTRYDSMPDQCYGIEVDGDSLAPFAKRGTVLVVSRAEYPVPGDDVVVTLTDGTLLVAEFQGDAADGISIVQVGADAEETVLNANFKVVEPIVDRVVVRPNRPRRMKIAE